jgi:CheY-like chemotaxis protein
MTEKIKVLAVDDHEVNLRLMSFILREAGFEPLTADDGDEVIGMLKAYPDTAAILLDRMMPLIDGLDALKHLKQLDDYKHIPVIMITAAWSKAQEAEAIEAGAYAYMAKPYDKVKIINTLKAALAPKD